MRNPSASIVAAIKDVAKPILFLIWILFTVVVAISGPFGTYAALTLGLRFLYWGGMTGLAFLIAITLRVTWRVILKDGPSWREDALVVFPLVAMSGPLVELANHLIWPDEVDLVSWQLVCMVMLFICIFVVALRRMNHGQLWPVSNQRDRLLTRIGAPKGARLGRVSSDNHHIRIKLVDGEEIRVLMRLRDAVADIDVEPGIYVHRSHWVALSQICEVETTDGREQVSLPCGNKLPVGPKYRDNLVQAGVLSA